MESLECRPIVEFGLEGLTRRRVAERRMGHYFGCDHVTFMFVPFVASLQLGQL
jgi:hypothetical protein